VKSKAQRQADNWNAAVNIGATIEYRETLDADPQRYQTRTEAKVLTGHTLHAVVWLVGKADCVSVSHCSKLPQA
jgi:hypothetical protein